jgi:hypothetical protein
VHLGRWRRLDHDTLSLLAGAARVYSTRCRERGRQIFEQRVEYPLPKETGVKGFISIETADAENLFWAAVQRSGTTRATRQCFATRTVPTLPDMPTEIWGRRPSFLQMDFVSERARRPLGAGAARG